MGQIAAISIPEVPVITVFVRHRQPYKEDPGCPHHADETYKRCKCPKHLRWSYAGKQFRQSAKTGIWAAAEDAKRRIENSYRPGSDPGPERKMIEDAVNLFISQKRIKNRAASTLYGYDYELNLFRQEMEKKSLYFMDELRDEHIITYQESWEERFPSSLTRANMAIRLRSFLKWCHKKDWLRKLPDVASVKRDRTPTMPYTDGEFQAILDTVPKMDWTDKRKRQVRALVLLMRHSGLAITDAVTLLRKELYKDAQGRYRVVTTRLKTGTDVSVVLRDEIAEEILSVPCMNQTYILWNTGQGKKKTVVVHYSVKLYDLFQAAKIENAHSHRFRDTFAVRLLEKGIPLEHVSKLLGHSSVRVTEQYYAPWVKERQDHLDDLVMGTWGGVN